MTPVVSVHFVEDTEVKKIKNKLFKKKKNTLMFNESKFMLDLK